MTDQIMTPEGMFRRGRDAALRGVERDGHHMNAQAPAVTDWQRGHDYVTKARAKLSRGQLVEAP